MSTKFGHAMANRRDRAIAPDYREQLKLETEQKSSASALQRFREELRQGEREMTYKNRLIEDLTASTFCRNGFVFRADQTFGEFVAQNKLDRKSKEAKREFARFRKGLELKIGFIKRGKLLTNGFTWTDIRWDYKKTKPTGQ